MTEVTRQALALAREGYRQFGSLVSGMESDDLDRPTRLAGWTVRDLVAHVAWGQAMEADALRRAVAGVREVASAAGIDAAVDSDHLTRSLNEAHRLFDDATARFAEQSAEFEVPLPAGTLGAPAAAVLFAVEAALHTSDLQDALGFDATLSPAAVSAAVAFTPALLSFTGSVGAVVDDGTSISLAGATLALTLTRRDGRWQIVADGSPADSGDGVTLRLTSDDEALVLFAFGRLPGSLDALRDRIEITGDGALAQRFKELFPGP